MATVDGLSVRISAATAQFQAGISRAQDAAGDLSLSLLRLGNSADRAESELDATGRSAATSAAGMSTFAVSTDGATLATTSLSGTLVASLLPALVTVAAALTPVVAALGGLAAIAGSILGVGLIGAIGGIATHSEELKEQFDDVVDVLLGAFAPAFDLAADVIEIWLREFTKVIPELVPAGDTMNEIASLFDQLGTAVIESLPAFVELAVALTREFLPPLIRMADDILPELPGIIMSLVDEFRRLIPVFQGVGRFLRRFLPEFLDFGRVALNVIAPALGTLGDATIQAFSFINELSGEVQGLIAAGSLLLPVLIGLVSFLGGPVTLAIGAVIGAVIGLQQVWSSNFAGIRDIAQDTWATIQPVLNSLGQAFQDFLSGIDMSRVLGNLEDFEQILGTQLQKNLEALQPVLTDFQEVLRDNSEEFETIGNAVEFLVVKGIQFAELLIKAWGPAFRNVVIPALSLFVDALDFSIDRIATMIELLGALDARNFQRAARLTDEIVPGERQTFQQALQPGAAIQAENISARQRNRIALEIRGEGELTDAIASESETQIREVSRRADRTGNRGFRS